MAGIGVQDGPEYAGYQGWVPFPRSGPRLVGPFYVIEITRFADLEKRAGKAMERDRSKT